MTTTALKLKRLLKLFDFEQSPLANRATSGERLGGPTVELSRALKLLEQEPSVLEIARLKTLISTGHLAEAQKVIEFANSNLSQPTATRIYEIHLDQARSAAIQGDWEKALLETRKGLSLHPPHLTVISFMQVQAAALFEMGYLKEALRLVDLTLSQEPLLPPSYSIFSSKILQVKLLGRTSQFQEASALLTKLWRSIDFSNLDSVINLLRLEIDLRRLSQAPVFEHARACYKISTLIGDSKVAGLALIDMAFSEKPIAQSEFSTLFKDISTRNPQIKRLLLEVLAKNQLNEDISTSAQCIRNYSRVETQSVRLSLSDVIERVDEVVFFGSQQKLLNLANARAYDLSSSFQTQQALTILSRGPTSKANLFSALWQQRYVPELHDIVIRNLLTRMKNSYGVSTHSSPTEVTLVGVISV